MEQQYYMLLATDADDVHEARQAARPEHLARLKALDEAGRLLTAGPNPLPDDAAKVSGSLIIARFDSLRCRLFRFSETLLKRYQTVSADQ